MATTTVLVPNASVLLPLPAQLVAPVAQLQADVAAGLQDGGGLVEQIPSNDAAAINGDVLAVEQAAAALFDSSDSTIASPALDAYYNAGAVAIVIAEPKATSTRLVLINPDLFALAQQYLGDYARWQEIAVSSGINPPDPQPVGLFTIVINGV